MMSRLRRGPQSRTDTEYLYQAGFSIVETMIVLAITGVLFVAIVASISGRQNRVQFNQAISQLKGEIEGVINEVQSGRFPEGAIFSCSGPNASGFLDIQSSSPREQGTNKDCAFLGKVLQFGDGYGAKPQRYAVHVLAGSSQVTGLATSNATVVQNLPDGVDLTERVALYNGLQILWARHGPGAPTGGANVGSVGIFTHIGSDEDGDAVGSRTAQIVPIQGTAMNEATITNITPTNIGSSTPNPDGGVRICVRSGTTQQSGLITLGGKAGASTVNLDIKETTNCS